MASRFSGNFFDKLSGHFLCRYFCKLSATSILVLSCALPCLAADAPAENQSMPAWLWADQVKPMFVEAGNDSSLRMLAGGLLATGLSFQYDRDLYERRSLDHVFQDGSSKYAAALGSGFPGIAVALSQIYFDRGNGLLHARTLALTSATHFSMALIVQRERPNKSNKLSFPSGHTSSSFATAASLAYAYGPWVGVPAFVAATLVGASRISDNAHWLSDTVGGAALGIYWASVSAKVKSDSQVVYYPIFIEDGLMAGMSYSF